MKVKDMNEMTPAELEAKLKELKGELFNLRFQNAINQLDNPHKIADVKKDIARVMTVLHEKKNA
ncbi:MAG: 50S ribosomal protein L29 [Eubacteriales bacterium]